MLQLVSFALWLAYCTLRVLLFVDHPVFSLISCLSDFFRSPESGDVTHADLIKSTWYCHVRNTASHFPPELVFLILFLLFRSLTRMAKRGSADFDVAWNGIYLEWTYWFTSQRQLGVHCHFKFCFMLHLISDLVISIDKVRTGIYPFLHQNHIQSLSHMIWSWLLFLLSCYAYRICNENIPVSVLMNDDCRVPRYLKHRSWARNSVTRRW